MVFAVVGELRSDPTVAMKPMHEELIQLYLYREMLVQKRTMTHLERLADGLVETLSVQ